ncbi:MAG TPA: hypothetical protein VH120_16750 [Gemmataceae bacterium]|nr:hypothetical protein [Gemmataceae bacterium]
MAEKGHTGFAHTDEERRQNTTDGGHASHEKGAANEFGDGGRRGNAGHAPGGAGAQTNGGEAGNTSDTAGNGSGEGGGDTGAVSHRSRRTRGGTHDQHVTAGKKGGSRIRQLIELGYKYEQEHGIGPGQNERSKLAAKRRATKSGGDDVDEGD